MSLNLSMVGARGGGGHGRRGAHRGDGAAHRARDGRGDQDHHQVKRARGDRGEEGQKKDKEIERASSRKKRNIFHATLEGGSKLKGKEKSIGSEEKLRSGIVWSRWSGDPYVNKDAPVN